MNFAISFYLPHYSPNSTSQTEKETQKSSLYFLIIEQIANGKLKILKMKCKPLKIRLICLKTRAPLKAWILQNPSIFLIIYSKASQKLKIMKFDKKCNLSYEKKIFSAILSEKQVPPPLKTWISQNPSNFLVIYSKASQRLKFLKFNQKTQTLLQKNNFGNFGRKSGPPS